jgi:hypothetical protein
MGQHKNWVWRGCSVCHTTDVTKFRKNVRTRSGYQSECQPCRNKRHKPYVYGWHAFYYFGLSPAAVTAKRAEQHELCAVCQKPLDSESRKPCIDHDRTCCSGARSCGKCVRGIIHQSCNTMLGMAHDDPDVLVLGSAYLHSWQNKTKPTISRG